MTVLIALFIAATIIIARGLAPGLADRNIVFDVRPDQPCNFGPDMAWIAIKTTDSAAVIDALRLDEPTCSNWNSGIGTIYDAQLGENRIFVSSPVNGWVFVAGHSLPQPHGRAFVDKCTPLLLELAGRFPEIQYFASYPEVDLFAWAKIKSGRLIRAFGVGDEGVIWTQGRTTRDERTLGLRLFELRGVRGRRGDAGGELLMHPTQEHVMRLAGYWSLNPTLLQSSQTAPALCSICQAPRAWRTQRLQRSA